MPANLTEHLTTVHHYPVASLLEVPEPPDGSSKILTLQIGGYYANEIDDTFEIFRILAIDAETIHVQPQAPTFTELPSNDADMASIHPTIGHLPLPLTALFMFTYNYIGTAELDERDLTGFETYLVGLDIDDTERQFRLQELEELSLDEPVRVDFTYHAGVMTHKVLN